MDFEYLTYAFFRILKFVPNTLLIAAISTVLSLTLAIPVAMLRIKKIPAVEAVLKIYMSFFASTPGLVHVFIVYYGIPAILKLFGVILGGGGKLFYASAALTLNYIVQFAEVIRPAYLSIDKGQHEAALSVGMTGWQKEKRIILPQVVPIALPAVANGFVELIKDTSILFVLGVQDIMGSAKTIISNDYGAKKLEVYVAVGIIYLVIITVSTIFTKRIEKLCSLEERRKRHEARSTRHTEASHSGTADCGNGVVDTDLRTKLGNPGYTS